MTARDRRRGQGARAGPADATLDEKLAADRERALRLTPVSRETAARLDRFVALLRVWQASTNLVAPSTLPALWSRHVADGLQIAEIVPRRSDGLPPRVWIDLGSGAGFPGLVLACALADTPGACVHLVESNGKKAAFLREAVRVTAAPAIVHAVRIEDFVDNFHESADIVTARALAPLERLLGYAAPLIERGAAGVFPKGQDIETELTEATKSWKLEANLVHSRTDPNAKIVVVSRLQRRAKAR